MKKVYLAALVIGVALGIAVVLPITGLASNWPLTSRSDSNMAGMMRSRMGQPGMALDSAGVEGSQGIARQATQREHQDLHERMHQMMDAVHGAGTSQRMHEAMGEDAEEMVDQCAAMMKMMQHMQGMMGNGGMMDHGGVMGGGMSMDWDQGTKGE